MQKLSIIHHRAVFKLPQTTANTPRLPTLPILTRPDYTMLYTTTPTTPAVGGRGDGGRQVGGGGGKVGVRKVAGHRGQACCWPRAGDNSSRCTLLTCSCSLAESQSVCGHIFYGCSRTICSKRGCPTLRSIRSMHSCIHSD